MNVKTTIVLAIVLIVGVGTYLILSPKTPTVAERDARPPEAEPEALYELSQLVTFEVERPGKPKLVFEKPPVEGKDDEYGDWQFVEPVQAKATNWEVNSFADKFKAPKVRQKFTPGEDGFPPAEKIGLTKPNAVITVTDKKGATKTIQVGDRVLGGEETYIKVAGQDKACVAEIDVRDDLKKEVEKFRSKDLFSFDKSKAVQVEIVHEGKTYSLVKSKEDKWVLDKPVKAVADASKVDSLLNDIRYMRVDEFVKDDPEDLKPFGLEKPKTRVEVTIETKVKKKEKEEDKPTTTKAARPKFETKRSTHSLLLGGASDLKGEEFYVKLGGKPWIASVTKSNRDKILPKPDEWRDKKVTQANVLDATKIQLTVGAGKAVLEKKGGAWRMVSPKSGKAEQSAVSDLLNAVKNLKASGWEEQPKDKAALGLDKPRAEIVLDIKGQTTPERLVVGGDTTSGLLTYVHRADSASVAVVKRDDAKKLLAPVLSYRDRGVLSFSKARADRIEVKQKDSKVVLEKQKGTWKMVQPVKAEADSAAVNDLLAEMSSVKAEADSAAVNDLLAEMSSLKAAQIAGEGDLTKYGLDKPEVVVGVRVSPPPKSRKAPTTTTKAATKPATKPAKPPKPKTYTVHVTRKGDDVFAVLPKGKLVYKLTKTAHANLVGELHDRTPMTFETSKVTGVEVLGGEKPLRFAKKGDKWSYVPDPHLTIDQQKVKDLVKAIHDVKAERYVSYQAKDLKPFGLDKPDLTVVVKTEDNKTVTMLLSQADAKGLRKATLKAKPDARKVFLVGKDDVKKLTKKIADFVKG